MTDIVSKLRFTATDGIPAMTGDQLLLDAADEIERLRADAERYRWLTKTYPPGCLFGEFFA